MEILIPAIMLMIIGSGMFSAIEAALFSIPLNKVKILEREKKKGADYLLKIKKDMRPTITVLVVFTNIFNIAGSIFVGAIAGNVFGSTNIGIFSAFLTFLVIIFAEIIPKSIGESFSIKISLSLGKPLFYTTKLFSPLVYFIEIFTHSLPKKKKTIYEKEIRALSDIGFSEGSIEKDENEMINQVFLLNDLRTKDIMTPRTLITSLKSNQKLKDIEKDIYSSSHSRMPVYKDNLDNITGICHQRDLLIALSKDEKERYVHEFSNHEVTRMHEDTKIDALIPIFRKQRCHLAIVVDEFKETVGIVTLEDVLEQIIGSVVDESD